MVTIMKKILTFTANQEGFVLPYILFFIAISFIIITADVHLYRDEIHIAQNHTEQLKVETLLQMGRTRFKDELTSGMDMPNPIAYEFPYGEVKISYTEIQETMYNLHLTIRTDKGTIHSLTNQLQLADE
ncbi:hypothetical protein EU245_00435 [Lentibacillus lipolyticus]|nr:hypothetical protein EU245_00435 [Lentibacillus lipolyticus]